MARIAPHHLPGHPKAMDTDYDLNLAWDDTAYVQWGRLQDGSAFFEAFTDNGIYIRTDEATLDKAESKAHALYVKDKTCKHQWLRMAHRNSAGTCRHCGLKNTSAFHPIMKLGAFRDPLNYHDISFIKGSGLRPRSDTTDAPQSPNSRYIRRLTISRALRLIPFVPAAQDVVLEGLPICNVLVLFRPCQPDGKTTDRCPARRLTHGFPMRKRVRGIWRTNGGRRASCAHLAAPARAGLLSEIARLGNVRTAGDNHP